MLSAVPDGTDGIWGKFVRMSRLVIRIANSVLFALCSYLTASAITQVAAEALVRPPASLGETVAPNRQSSRSWSDRKPILDRNLFGAQIAGDQAPVVDTVEDLEETKLPLTLLGTANATDPALSNAAIEDNGSKKHQVVRIGDRLDAHRDVEVVAIERKRVILQNGPRREELVLDEEEQPVARSRRTTARAPRARPDRRASRSRLSSRLKELREQAAEREDAGGRTPASLFSEARILPKYEDGEMVGIQLSAIKSGSFYEKFGFQDGDVITELNGIRIDNPSASAKLLNELTEAEEFTFEKLGPNGPEKFTVPADEVSRLLGNL